MSECIFCSLAQGGIPTEFLYEDEHVVAFNDMHPQAKHHFLVVPKKHVLNFLDQVDVLTLASMQKAVQSLVFQYNLEDAGVRLIMNCGEGAGQTVMHLHMHVLSGDTVKDRLV